MLVTLVTVLHGAVIAVTSLFIVCCLIPWLHEPLRSVFRPWVVHHVERGLVWVEAAQRWEHPLLTSLFQISSHVVGVGFYATFLPALHFLGLPELCWHLVALMTLTIYVGNSMKDLVCAPRPLNVTKGKHKVQYLGGGSTEAEKNAKEYGLPSSHTMNSITLNFFLAYYLHRNGLVSPHTAHLLYAIAGMWMAWIAASRLYLGLHTPVDIITGAIAGVSVLAFFLTLEDAMNWWGSRSRHVILQQLLASALLLRLCPRPMSFTPSFEFTTSFFGAFFGATAGLARHPEQVIAHPIQLADVWAHGPLWALRRLVLGFAVVILCKEASRAFFLAALPPVYRFFPFSLRRLWQPPVHNVCPPSKVPDARMRELPHNAAGKTFDVDLTSRFFAYAGIGFAVFEVAPLCFQLLSW